MQNVSKTVQYDLCVSCGLCRGICPQKSIEMVFDQKKGQSLPKISDSCNGCGTCLKICPGIQVDLYKNNDLSNLYTGDCLGAYIGYAKDKFIRSSSTSGGLVTSIIFNLLLRKLYNGAFVAQFDKNEIDGKSARLTYITEAMRVSHFSKSKYIPVFIDDVLVKLDTKDNIIIVGTPCQIHGIKQFMIHNKIEGKNHLFLGLFCDKIFNYNILDYYRDKYVKVSSIDRFYFRDKEISGWPGNTKIVLSNGESIFVDRSIRRSLKTKYGINRCKYCIDKLNRFSDISFGDCYISGEGDVLGKSNIIIRTEKGKEIFELIKDECVFKEIDISLIAQSQKIYDKKKTLDECIKLENSNGIKIYPGLGGIK